MRHLAEANLLALIDSSEDMWGSVDLEYRLIVFNKNFHSYIQQSFGVDVTEGMNPSEVLPPERAAVWPQLFDRALQQGAYHFEHLLTNGHTLEIALHPILRDGKATGVSLYGRDVTDRLRAEEQLRDSEERFRATFEQAAIGIVHTSTEGLFLRCNHRFAEILGYSIDEIPGMDFMQLTVPEDRVRSAAAFTRMMSGEVESHCIEKRYLRKNGDPVWTKLTISKQRDGQGRTLHFVTFVEDIEQHKAVEARLEATAKTQLASETRYRTAFHNCLDCFAIIRVEDGIFLEVNQAFIDISGYGRKEVIGNSSLDLNFWVDEHARDGFVHILRRDALCRNFEARFRKKDGKVYWGRISSSMIELDGQLCHLAQIKDISESKAALEQMNAATEALRRSEERYRIAFQTSLDGISLSHLDDGLFIDVNPAFLRMFGYPIEEVIGRTSIEMNIWGNVSEREKMVELLRESNVCHSLEVQFQRKNGEPFWVQLSAAKIDLDGVPSILLVIRDNSEAKAAAEKIEDLAFFDPLTRLPNRQLLMDRVRQTLASTVRGNRKLALLLLDLDNFKTINETLGHQAGDLLLQEVAKRLRSSVRESDLVARLGGDEFVVMLEDLSEEPKNAAEQAQLVGEKLRSSIARPFQVGGRECISTASLGITVFGDRSEETGEVLQQADIAMDQAKSSGGNTTRFFAPALQVALSAKAALEEDLRQAIREKQFVLYYQPQISRGRMVGTEALIRWRHPQRGIVAPNGFIPIAEETGLILDLGNWVLETACEQIARWAEQTGSAKLAVAVNISALQFRQPEFEQQVMAALRRTGADPSRLKLELTESMLVDNIEDVIAKMTSLRSREIAFSLDDFGTGYSSLSYLKRLPLDQLKIDRSFVKDILTDSSSGAIAETIISLGRAMGMPVIAEGVETEPQRVFLARLGCHSFQGYLVSPPLPLEKFQDLLFAFEKSALPYSE